MPKPFRFRQFRFSTLEERDAFAEGWFQADAEALASYGFTISEGRVSCIKCGKQFRANRWSRIRRHVEKHDEAVAKLNRQKTDGAWNE